MSDQESFSRRDFLKSATAAAVGTSLATVPNVAGAYAAGSDEIRIGVIGCGGRGTGAAGDALRGAEGVRLVAMCDAFADRLDRSREMLTKKFGEAAAVSDDHCFIGLDGYEKLLATDINYVILATPPGFRPLHLEAAVAAGKHIFTEKPVAVDGPGIRRVLAVADTAAQKSLAIGAGTQRRHQHGYIETMRRVHGGAIGDLVAARCYWNQGFLWNRERQPDWTDVEWQMRNWLYFTWLSGDHIVEQHVHNIDVVNWAMQGHPASAVALAGRQVRTAPEFGNIYDHFAVDFEYANGVHALSMCRQIENCANRIAEALVGTKGTCDTKPNEYEIKGAQAWTGTKDPISPYVQEHTDLIESIRKGTPINELEQVAESTLTAIMGRMSAYTGQLVTWEQALNSEVSLVPETLELGPMPVPPVAMPGQSELS
ncbi:MAG: twin-arginine translocation signal domain-containing protein [Luteitalea sp.]|nr:twin-arginine translocation signal domain-containing protein [Luteitalea sp.]